MRILRRSFSRSAAQLAALSSLVAVAASLTACGRAPASVIAVRQAPLTNALDKPYKAPELADITGWINSKPLTIESLRGKVVLIDFWTYSCINCVRTLPHLEEWDQKYRDKGLVIIGVHSPEFKFEKDIPNIEAAVAKYHIKYPIAVDSNLGTWNAYRNQYWPAHYLIDRTGKVVYTFFGEGDYDVTENNIRRLLGLKGDVAAADDATASESGQTVETYLGSERAERRVADGTTNPPLGHWALGGNWKQEPEKIVSAAPGAAVRLHFNAKKVFLVMGSSTGKPVDVTLRLNGDPPGGQAGADVHGDRVTITGYALYELINQDVMTDTQLELTADGVGAEFYAFTFGG